VLQDRLQNLELQVSPLAIEFLSRVGMIPALSQQLSRARCASSLKRRAPMKKILSTVLSLLFVFSVAVMAQNSNSSTTSNSNNSNAAPKKPRKPIFRANKDQVQQAQKILKDRSFYSGEQTGKLDADTRAGLKKYQ